MTSTAPALAPVPAASPVPAARAAPPAPRRSRASLALALAPALMLALAAWRLRWVSEDGFIYLRIADNLLAGHGPVFNPGERVEAYTGPAWLALLALAAGLPGTLESAAVALGVLLSATGLACATLGALALRGRDRADRSDYVVLPLGAVVVAALPPFWDFATAGLETSLVLAWVGGCFLALARGAHRPFLLAVAIGAGPLVRPDLAPFAAAFLAVALVLRWEGSPRRALGLVVAAAALPLAYQVFRMGYFASLLPNTALAKEAGLTAWGRGGAYLAELVGAYALWVPLAVLLALALGVRGRPRGRDALVAGAPVVAALVHAVYVVRLGGDYMHARMLLPSLFALVAPVAVVALPRRALGVGATVVVAGWALVCASGLRASADRTQRVYDQRRAQLTPPGHAAPVRIADHLPLPFSQPFYGSELARLARERPGAVVLGFREGTVRLEGRALPAQLPVPLARVRARRDLGARTVAFTGSIGRVGYAGGEAVRIVDKLGLADPVAGRLRLEGPRSGKAGHEKELPAEWVLARFADPATLRGPAPGGLSAARIAAARRALGCGSLREVLVGATAPLDAGRFVANLGVAWRTRALRIAPDPARAAEELCG